jgi:hypothetical protein
VMKAKRDELKEYKSQYDRKRYLLNKLKSVEK